MGSKDEWDYSIQNGKVFQIFLKVARVDVNFMRKIRMCLALRIAMTDVY